MYSSSWERPGPSDRWGLPVALSCTPPLVCSDMSVSAHMQTVRWRHLTTGARRKSPSELASLGLQELRFYMLLYSLLSASWASIKHKFVYQLDHLGGTVSAILTYIIGLFKFFRNLYLCYISVYSNCNCFYAKLGTLNHMSFVLNQPAWLSFYFSVPGIFSPNPQHEKPDPETRLKINSYWDMR